MKTTLKSIFAKDINDFYEFRLCQGYTIENAVKYLRKFDAYCCEKNPEDGALTQELVHGWLQDAANKGYVDMAGRGGSIRIFAKYLRSMGNEAYVLPPTYYSYKSNFVPYILSQSELSAFFKATDELSQWHCGDRFAPILAPVLFRLMCTSGLRPSEVRGIKNSDVNLHTGEIHITANKRKKERIIVVSDDMLRLMTDYETSKNMFFVRTEYFFPRTDGSQYSSQQLGTLCDKCWHLANLDTPHSSLPALRPYDFRHSFASSVLQRWIDEGKDLYTMLPYLRAYMGHEHFSDTAYYIHILPERLLTSQGVDWELLDSAMPEVGIWD